MFHDVRWGAEHDGRFLWVLLNSGSGGAYAFNHDPDTLRGVHSYRQPPAYFPIPGGTFAGESLPGAITWARAYIDADELVMDVGRGEVVKLPPAVRDAWWEGTTRQWPFMAADLGIGRDDLMAHYLSNHVAVAYGDVFDEMVALSRASASACACCRARRDDPRDSLLGIDVGTGSARAGLFDTTAHGRPRRTPDRGCADPNPTSSSNRPTTSGARRRGHARRARGRGAYLRRRSPASASTRPARSWRSTSRATPVTVSAARATTNRTSSCGWTTARSTRRSASTRPGIAVLRYVGGVDLAGDADAEAALAQAGTAATPGAHRALVRPARLPHVPRDRRRRPLAVHAVCKWTYLGHERRWDASFFEAIGLGDLADDGFARIGARVRVPGERVGGLDAAAATTWGSRAGTPVGVSIIDAHAGALGMLGAAGDDTPLDRRLALIAGTSACHLAVSADRFDVSGVWGPYWEALLAGRWLTEAGISASGTFLDFALRSHPAFARAPADPYAELERRVRSLAADPTAATMLAADRHWQPNVLGNRAPLADADPHGRHRGSPHARRSR